MKQILILQAGRPKGNTARLSEAVAEGAREAGHRVEIVQLNTVDIRGCLGCNACRYQRPCVQRDDFAAVREKIEAADCLIFASPLYFWTISARLKAVIERFYCLAASYRPHPLAGMRPTRRRTARCCSPRRTTCSGPLNRR